MELRVVPQPAALAAERIGFRLVDAIRRRGSATVAFSGGSTAPPMLDELADIGIEWANVTAYQVDERVAPDGDPRRNASQLEVLPCQVRLMPVTSRDHERAMRRYAASLPERFDVMHLGVGSDGHTASWPPSDVRPIRSARAIELIEDFHGIDRMTLTRRVVNGARSRVVLATGDEKRPMLERWLEGDRSIPISHVRQSGTWVVVDHAAAPPPHR